MMLAYVYATCLVDAGIQELSDTKEVSKRLGVYSFSIRRKLFLLSATHPFEDSWNDLFYQNNTSVEYVCDIDENSDTDDAEEV